jgi:tetraacyldisaccharide 4'-kinase
MSFWGIILLPLSILYGCFMALRNILFEKGWLPVYRPPVKSIGIGNLNTGGTGKSPLAAYIATEFKDKTELAFVSRGYRRKTKGFHLAGPIESAETLGDEPFEIYQKLKGMIIAVDGRRIRACKRILKIFPSVNLFVFDDIYQHRSVKPGLNILLTEYSRPYYDDFVLPSGNLREFKSGKKRADVIIVTKSPAIFSPIERRHILEKIKPEAHQQVFFSYYRFNRLLPLNDAARQLCASQPGFEQLQRDTYVIAFCGIASPLSFENYIREHSDGFDMETFPDHHRFTEAEYVRIAGKYLSKKHPRKIILTTQKDASRIDFENLNEKLKNLPMFAPELSVDFHGNDKSAFLKLLNQYVGTN